MKNSQKNNSVTYLIYIIILVAFLVVITISATYAYFKVDVTKTQTMGNLSAAIDCIDISYSETDIIDLDYNYPISDDYAMTNIVPVTIKVANKCINNTEHLNYTLSLTALSNTDTEDVKYITNDKIRLSVKRTLDSDAETTFKEVNYLSNLTPLTSGNAYSYLTGDLDNRDSTKAYTNRKSYIIDSSTIGNGKTNIYKVYLWVDYYEGDYKMYDTVNYPDYEHDEMYDNTTQDKRFAAAISLVVNP